ncbi:MAG: aldehyde ferredoxin oxidoreductase C-terminal domain-containing protein, partial [Anaerolineales bacterium]
PAHNSQDIGVDYADQIGGEHFREFLLVGEPTCHACPVACKKEVEVTFRGLTVRTESVEYETAWAFGANSGNKDANAIGFMVYQCNDFGVDTIEMGNVLATYMEICQHGWNDDVTLEWGDAELMTQLVELTVRREGIGDKLAEGVLGLAKAFGHPEVAMAVRGQSIPAYDPRGQKGMGIGYATSNRGGCHLRAYATASELGVIEPVTDPLAYEGKGELIGIFQNIHAFSDSLDLCKFSAFAQSPNEYAAMYAAMTGREFTAEDVLAAGARIYTLERYYNQLAGDTPANDTIPTRFLEEPSKAEASLGHVCELEPMLEEYYAFRGWENGIVSDDNLRAVGILD